MKTKEQLMAPRYRVIAGYPDNRDFPLNAVIDCSVEWAGGWKFEVKDCQGLRSYTPDFFEMYPHLFQLAHWSDNRLPDEFPQYVICDGKVEKVLEVKTDEAGFVTKIVTDDYPQFFSADIFKEPATEEEYLAYKKANP